MGWVNALDTGMEVATLAGARALCLFFGLVVMFLPTLALMVVILFALVVVILLCLGALGLDCDISSIGVNAEHFRVMGMAVGVL